MLIIIFFSQIAQATTLEKFNVTCFPRGWHNKNISFCSMFSNHNVWNETLLVFPSIFFPYFFQTQRFPRIIFLYLFKSQRLKYFVTCVMLSNIFPLLFQKQIHFRHRIYFLQVLYFIYFYYKMYQYYSML